MTASQEALAELQAVLRKEWTAVTAAGRDYAQACREAHAQTDLVAAMGDTVAVISTAERLAEAATHAAQLARAALSHQMQETGAHHIHSGGMTAYLSRKPAYVSITQPDLVPDEYYTTPEPKLDGKRIKAAIDGGIEVPGATIIRPNEMTMGIRGAKQQ